MNRYTPEEEIELLKADIGMAIRQRDEHQRLVNMFNEQITSLLHRLDQLLVTS